jgi:transposase
MECPTCAASLQSVEIVGLLKRQVFDIPPPKLAVTEHQAEVKWCPICRQRVTAVFPEGVSAPVQYGKFIQSWVVYFQQQQFIPEDRLQETLSDLIGARLATATLNKFSESVYDKLVDFNQEVLSKVQKAPVKHLDETGFRVTSKTQWLHVASTRQLTYYHVSAKRKSLLEGLRGTVVHDHWKPYYQLLDVTHALCNQHHLRELKALVEYDKEAWARKMQRLLRFAAHYRHAYGEQAIPENRQNRLIALYDRIVQEGFAYHEQLPVFSVKKGRGRTARRPGHNLLLRLRNYREDVLRFLIDPNVPFTNNQAERDIRMMKCKQKISGSFRSTKGAEMFARIRSFISTARKQGWNIFESIQQVIESRVPLPA